MYSAYKLNKQGDNVQPWRTPFPIWNQSVVPCPVLTAASWPAYRFVKRQVRWSGIPISWRIFHSIPFYKSKASKPLWDTANGEEKERVEQALLYLLLNVWCYYKWHYNLSTNCNMWVFSSHQAILHILQARILEWVAFPFSRGSSQSRYWTQVSHIAGRFFTSWAIGEAQEY